MDVRLELADIVAESATLVERLDTCHARAEDARRSDVSDARLERWRQVAAEGDEARFDRRLRWDSRPRGHAESALGASRRWASDAAEWALLFGEACALRSDAGALAPTTAGSERRSEPALPFEHVIEPFVRAARRRLRRHPAAHDAVLSPAAHADLEQGLRHHLSGVALQTLWSEFSFFREQRGGPARGDALYRSFVAEILGGRWLDFFRSYPVLTRLLSTRALDWIDATAELALRVLKSHDTIAAALNAGRPLGNVESMRLQLSDSHNRGRSVAILRFGAGIEVVYKPRSVAPERCYYAFVAWLNRQGLSTPLGTLAVIDEGDFGWMQVAEPYECRDLAAVRRYYERAGMLLCLAYALGYADLHAQNLIASGEQPLLVDLEVAMRARWEPLDVVRSRADPLAGSVLRSHLLPYYVVEPVERRARIKGGYATAAAAETWWRETWRAANSGAMRCVRERQHVDDSAHAPRLGGVVMDVAPFTADVQCGFRALYELLVARRAELLAPTGPLAMLVNQPSRVVLRNTATYLELLRRSLRPELLRSGVDRSIELEVLAKEALRAEHRPAYWKAVGVEIRSLERLDVPAFRTRVSGRDLETDDGERLPDFFAESGYARVRARLASLDDQDRQAQSELIRGRLADYVVRRNAPRHETSPSDTRLSRASALREAESVARVLAALVRQGDRGPTWTELTTTSPTLRVAELGPGLFTGTAGISLFLAAVAKAAGRSALEAPGIAGVGPSRRGLRARAETIAASDGVGADGLAGLVYALARAGTWSGDAKWQRCALPLVEVLGATGVAAAWDVQSGMAGALLALLFVHRVTGERLALAAALRCGTRLLASRSTHPGSGLRAWADGDGRMRSGFARGAAGVAYALRRLHGVTKNADFLTAAVEAERFEDRLFLPETGDWLESAPRPREAPRLALPRGSLSAGAAGIGVARIAGGAPLASGSMALECVAAAQRMLDAQQGESDSLGQGRLGAIELLFTAAAALGEPALRAAAERHLARIVRRARLHGYYDLGDEQSLRPSLFRGLAGVGYMLLRHARSRVRSLRGLLLLQ